MAWPYQVTMWKSLAASSDTISQTLRMTSERNYNEVEGENEALSFGYYDDDDDFDTFTDGDGDCGCDEGG